MLILDFYVDEPACFGVPPYLSPYARYAAGALVAGGIPQEHIDYLTVDAWRAQGKRLKTDPELVVVVAGTTVPGKYLGGKIGTVAELLEFLDFRQSEQPGGATLIGGPIRYASKEIREEIASRGGILVRGDLEVYAERVARDPAGPGKAVANLTHTGERHTYEQVDRWATRGAFLTNLHPNFPYLILELETYRGCTRDVFCSFCTEAFYGKPTFRSLNGIISETAELYTQGNRYFRLGRQADLLTYLPNMADFKNSFPRPVPESLAKLYAGIRQAAPDLKLLHLDNINPGLIATFPTEAAEIIRIISAHNTPGDTAAMGLESLDENVIAANDLKCSPTEALRAIEIVNEFGARRTDGVPHLLPGINLLHGLPGESVDTFERNFDFLANLLVRGLLVRRINIRQTVSYENTKLDRLQNEGFLPTGISKKKLRPDAITQRFMYYRDRIRKEIDRPMLRRNFPSGTLIREVILETENQGYFLGRPLGSYPVTIKIPKGDHRAAEFYHRKEPLTAFITGAEERSLVGLSHPVHVGQLDERALAHIPGVGRRSGELLVKSKPKSFEELRHFCDGTLSGTPGDFVFGTHDAAAAKP